LKVYEDPIRDTIRKRVEINVIRTKNRQGEKMVPDHYKKKKSKDVNKTWRKGRNVKGHYSLKKKLEAIQKKGGRRYSLLHMGAGVH